MPLKLADVNPIALGLSQKDMTTGGPYTSKVLDLSQAYVLSIFVETVVVGAATVGEVDLTWQRVDNDDNDVGDPVTLMTGIPTGLGGGDTTYKAVISMGAGIAAEKVGTGTLGGSIDSVRVFGRGKIIATLNPASDAATSALMDIRVQSK